MPSSISYRKVTLDDVSSLEISPGMSATRESLEFNVLGMGHELWIAVEARRIIGLAVLGRPGPNEFKVMYLEVAPSHKNKGIGSSLMQEVLVDHPEGEFSVIPFEGTEQFYHRLGFERVSRWEMRRPPTRGLRGGEV